MKPRARARTLRSSLHAERLAAMGAQARTMRLQAREDALHWQRRTAP